MRVAPSRTPPPPVAPPAARRSHGGLTVRAEVVPHALAAHAVSAAARVLAERLCAEVVGVPLRVASLAPSGRPIVSPTVGIAPCVVSVAHTRGLLAAAASRDALGVGIDVVTPDELSAALDWCFTASDDAGRDADGDPTRARLWSAKEAAYKAARIDIGFQPRQVRVRACGQTRFRWTIGGPFATVRGIGAWHSTATHTTAVAVLPTPGGRLRFDALTVIIREGPAA